MTIYTKQNAVNEEKKGEPKVELDVAIAPPTKQQGKEVPVDFHEVGSQRIRRQRKRRLCLQLILLLALVIGLCVCVLVAIVIHRKNASRRFHGWCGVKAKHSKQTHGAQATAATKGEYIFLDEEVIINDDVETLEVPKFDDNDQATFTLDFKRNITAIKDITDKVCYIMPLDTKKVPPPRSFIDLLMRSHDFIPDAEEVSEDYGVEKPPLSDDEVRRKYGDYIADLCTGYTTSRLVPLRPTELPPTTTPSLYHRRFAMYPGGVYIIRYRIALF